MDPEEPDNIKAVSVGFGIFMGIAPIWGFQLATAIGLSFLLRLNKALVIIAANISIPPMIPVILYLSHVTGKMWMGDRARTISFSDEITFEMINNHFLQYMFGAVTLATVSGIAFGCIAYILLKIWKRSRKYPFLK